MARFDFIISQGDFSVTRQEDVLTDCATIFSYEITTAVGNTVNFRIDDFGSFAENGKYFIDGNESPFSGSQVSLTYSSPITVTFSIQNSGVSGQFDSVDFVVNDTTTTDDYNSYTNTATRESDNPKCNVVEPGFVTRFDELDDTPNSKVGQDGKIPVVNEATDSLDYVVPSDLFNPSSRPVENTYNDIPEMLADQANQTEGFLQYVIDAGADPEITVGTPAYYEKLATSTGSLPNDYRRLSDGEAENAEDSNAFRTFIVESVQDDTTPVTTVQSGNLSFEFLLGTGNVTGVIFNVTFSDIIERFVSLSGTVEYSLKFYNRTTKKYQLAKISGFQTVNIDYIKATLEDTITASSFSVDDKVEVEFDVRGDALPEPTLEKDVNLPSHGFTVGQWIKKTDTGYSLAQADTAENADVIGVVSKVQDINNFTYQYAGIWVTSNLVVGENYFLSVSVAGGIDHDYTNYNEGEVHQFVGTAISTTELQIEIDAGFEIGVNEFGDSPNEENISGTIITDTNVTGTKDIDWDAGSVFRFTLTGDTTFSDINLPAQGSSKVIQIVLNGQFVSTLPAGWTASPKNDTYNGVNDNLLTATITRNDGTLEVYYTLENMS